MTREIDRLREAANLDPAEIAPEPLAALARLSRRFHLGLVALVLAAACLASAVGLWQLRPWARGLQLVLAAVSLLAAHLHSGLLNAVTAPFSALLLIPAYLGMQAGFLLSDRLNPDTFRRITLVVLTLAGLNLMRKGLFG